MRVDIPQLSRCCFCMPLRRGLLTWVYIKLVVALLVSLFLLGQLIMQSSSSRRPPDIFYVSMIIALIAFTSEIVFDIIFLYSAHTKNFEYLRIYYRYALVMLLVQVIAVLAFIGFEIYLVFCHPFVIFMLHFMMEVTFFAIGQTALQLYFVILVRSELHKLENNTQFEFVNHTSDPECKAQIVV